MAALGNGENRAYIYDRLGTTRLLELVTTRVEWPRELCAVSKATVVVGASRCGPDHDRISTWAHTLVIFRDGQRAWEGPIRRRLDGPNGLTLTASDVLGWTERRPMRQARQVGGSPVVNELDWTVRHAFAEDDPNVLAHLSQPGFPLAGGGVDRDVQAGAAYCSAELGNLVGAGGRYTALGRSILLWDHAYQLGRTATLVPERHLLTDVNVIEDGDLLGESVWARDDQGNQAYVDSGIGVDPYYGRVTLLVSTGSSTSAAGYAQTVRAQSYPAPVTVDVPSGAALSCDAPFPMEHLVPGVVVPLETTTATGKQVSATFALNSVKVVQEAGRDETVGVTLAPLSTAVQ